MMGLIPAGVKIENKKSFGKGSLSSMLWKTVIKVD